MNCMKLQNFKDILGHQLIKRVRINDMKSLEINNLNITKREFTSTSVSSTGRSLDMELGATHQQVSMPTLAVDGQKEGN